MCIINNPHPLLPITVKNPATLEALAEKIKSPALIAGPARRDPGANLVTSQRANQGASQEAVCIILPGTAHGTAQEDDQGLSRRLARGAVYIPGSLGAVQGAAHQARALSGGFTSVLGSNRTEPRIPMAKPKQMFEVLWKLETFCSTDSSLTV